MFTRSQAKALQARNSTLPGNATGHTTQQQLNPEQQEATNTNHLSLPTPVPGEATPRTSSNQLQLSALLPTLAPREQTPKTSINQLQFSALLPIPTPGEATSRTSSNQLQLPALLPIPAPRGFIPPPHPSRLPLLPRLQPIPPEGARPRFTWPPFPENTIRRFNTHGELRFGLPQGPDLQLPITNSTRRPKGHKQLGVFPTQQRSTGQSEVDEPTRDIQPNKNPTRNPVPPTAPPRANKTQQTSIPSTASKTSQTQAQNTEPTPAPQFEDSAQTKRPTTWRIPQRRPNLNTTPVDQPIPQKAPERPRKNPPPPPSTSSSSSTSSIPSNSPPPSPTPPQPPTPPPSPNPNPPINMANPNAPPSKWYAKIPRYDGSSDPRKYLQRFEQCMQTNGWNDQTDWINKLGVSMDKEAEEFFYDWRQEKQKLREAARCRGRNLPDPTITDLATDLIRNFATHTDKVTLEEKCRQRKQKINENPEAYVFGLVSLLKSMDPDITELQKVQWLIKNARPDTVRLANILSPTTVEQFTNILRKSVQATTLLGGQEETLIIQPTTEGEEKDPKYTRDQIIDEKLQTLTALVLSENAKPKTGTYDQQGPAQTESLLPPCPIRCYGCGEHHMVQDCPLQKYEQAQPFVRPAFAQNQYNTAIRNQGETQGQQPRSFWCIEHGRGQHSTNFCKLVQHKMALAQGNMQAQRNRDFRRNDNQNGNQQNYRQNNNRRNGNQQGNFQNGYQQNGYQQNGYRQNGYQANNRQGGNQPQVYYNQNRQQNYGQNRPQNNNQAPPQSN
jgi:hypothetical protein